MFIILIAEVGRQVFNIVFKYNIELQGYCVNEPVGQQNSLINYREKVLL